MLTEKPHFTSNSSNYAELTPPLAALTLPILSQEKGVMHRSRRPWILFIGLSLSGVSACTSAHFVEFRNGTGERSTGRAFLLADAVNTGGGPAALGPVAGDVALVRYDIDEEQRVYLLRGDLAFIGGDSLHLPWMRSDDPRPRDIDIGPYDPTQWTSFRVYDQGACSILIPWQNVARMLIDKIRERIRDSDSLEGVRFMPANVRPWLKAASSRGPLLTEDTDFLEVIVPFSVQSIDIPFPEEIVVGCEDVTVVIRFQLGFERIDPTHIVYPGLRTCLLRGDLAVDSRPESFRHGFRGRVELASASVSGGSCDVRERVGDRLSEQIRSEVPFEVERTLRQLLLLDPAPGSDGFEYKTRRGCTCSWSGCSDVDGFPPGLHQCVLPEGATQGECRVQAEPDRMNFRPEGLELVLSEGSSDPQDAWMHDPHRRIQLCLPSRNRVDLAAGPQLVPIPSITVP